MMIFKRSGFKGSTAAGCVQHCLRGFLVGTPAVTAITRSTHRQERSSVPRPRKHSLQPVTRVQREWTVHRSLRRGPCFPLTLLRTLTAHLPQVWLSSFHSQPCGCGRLWWPCWSTDRKNTRIFGVTGSSPNPYVIYIGREVRPRKVKSQKQG